MIADTKLVRWFKAVLWAVALSGLVAGAGRFIFGLGAATNMTDSLPWGWWKIFNMVAGAALATSGFVVAAIIYIFQWDRYRSVARLSVVVGFLGYGSSLFSLLFDIGLPHRGWHPFFMWNPHSFLFEVFWCVSVYWSVTALELVPILTERMPFPKVTNWIHDKILPVVVLGITLSTMHHSSLGSLFMASPTRLYPLWHSFWIPPEFLISAMGGGLATIALLLLATSHLYGRKPDAQALDGLAKGAVLFLWLYLIIKIADFSVNGKWGFVFGPDLTWESVVFWVEISLQALVPVLLLSVPRWRRSEPVLTVAGLCALFGLLMHRIDTGIVGYFRTSEAIYIPNLSELLVSFGVLSAAGLFFFFLVERFYILDADHDQGGSDHHAAHESTGIKLWTKKEFWSLMTGPATRRVVLTLVVVVPLTWISLRDQATGAFQPLQTPVTAAINELDSERQVFRIDANQNGMHTDFGHYQHQQDLAGLYGFAPAQSCNKCHHLRLPGEEKEQSACRKCHRDMQIASPLFSADRHRQHAEEKSIDPKCAAIDFWQIELQDRQATFAACACCHEQNMAGLLAYQQRGFDMRAPSFTTAMHGNCLTCHRLRERMQPEQQPDQATSTGNCLFCHRQWADPGMF